jgi:hypothetical protein
MFSSEERLRRIILKRAVGISGENCFGTVTQF